jgi:hypothetical protein
MIAPALGAHVQDDEGTTYLLMQSGDSSQGSLIRAVLLLVPQRAGHRARIGLTKGNLRFGAGLTPMDRSGGLDVECSR